MVVAGIIIVISSVVLTSNGSFNKTLILANTAYDIALTLRSAETYGLGSRIAPGGVANAGYGLNFKSATPGSFTLFADIYPPSSSSSRCHQAADPSAPDARPGDCAYEADRGERVTDYNLGNGITVSNFCARASGGWSCANAHDGYGGGLTSLDIVFARPNPEAYISVNGLYSALFRVTQACLTISSPQDSKRFISILTSGQITANAPSCP